MINNNTISSNNNKNHKINFMSDIELFNEILNSLGEILIFDFRDEKSFKLNHFSKYSINLPYNSKHITYDFCNLYDPYSWEIFAKNDNEKKIIKHLKRYHIVIISSNTIIKKCLILNLFNKLNRSTDFSDEEECSLKAIIFYNTLINNKIREISYFTGDYSNFLNKYNNIINFNYNIFLKRSVFKDPYPSSILDYRLYVGDESHARNDGLLILLGITHIINVTSHVPNYFENRNIEYLNIKVEDIDGHSIYPFFKIAFEFIDNAFFPKLNTDLNWSNNGLNDYTETLSTNLKLNHELSIKDQFELNNNKNLENQMSRLKESILDSQDNDCYKLKNQLVQIQFIYNQYKNSTISKNNVLIHCSLGVSRSPCIAIMYILKKFNLSYKDAYEIVKFQRNKSCPIQTFCNDLEKLENDY